MPLSLTRSPPGYRSRIVLFGTAIVLGGLINIIALISGMQPALAQSGQAVGQNSWSAGVEQAPNIATDGLTSTLLPQQTTPPPTGAAGSTLLTLSAYLTAEVGTASRRAIDRGLVWRVFTIGTLSAPAKLIMSRREASPTIRLPVGQYAINAAFGRAHLTQIVEVDGSAQKNVPFILNAGGLRVITRVVGGGVGHEKARYDIYSDERNQSGDRLRIVSDAKPGLITRLNSGIYHIVSRLGDANALVSAEVAVEAGKLTEAVVSHEAAKVTFKLVKTTSGEAHADTQWIIMTQSGDIVKETAGALPTHVLAPGTYSVSARWGGQHFTRTFDVQSGGNVEVEVMMQ